MVDKPLCIHVCSWAPIMTYYVYFLVFQNTTVVGTTLAEQLNCGLLTIFMTIIHSLKVIHCYNCTKPILKTCGISSTINTRVWLILVAAGLVLAKFKGQAILVLTDPQTPQRVVGSVLDWDLIQRLEVGVWSCPRPCNSLKWGRAGSGWVRE